MKRTDGEFLPNLLKARVLLTRKLLGAALLVSVLASACSKGETTATAGGPPALPVKVQTVQSDDVQDTSEFVGTLEASQRATLQPQIEGRIEQIFVANGDRVRQGTPIVSLSIDQTQADVTAQQAATNSSRAALRTSQAQLQAAEADQAKAQADVDLQQIQFKRTQQLVVEGAQSREQLDIARNNLETAIATLEAARKNVNASRASVSQSEAGVREAQAKTASTSVNLNFKQVAAPISGVVGDFPVKIGDYVTTQSTLTTITRNDTLDMRISVPSGRSGQLRAGLPVQLVDPNTGKSLASGSVNFISPRVDSDAQVILIKARFSNGSGNLRDGQYVRAKVIWGRTQGLLVPSTAISRIGGQSFVFVAQEDKSGGEAKQVAHQRPVTLGPIQGNSYQVTQGVKAGDRVVISNILKLRDGTPVKPES
jgi:RND family efflux transporter MFP subunit